jgi:predicted small metal-binding protein
MKTITCRDAGFDCDYIVKGETEEEVMKRGAEHAMKDHGIKEEDITPEFKEKVRGLISYFLTFTYYTCIPCYYGRRSS